MKEKIDIHAHYFPPAYDQMLEKRGMKLLDGGFPKSEWNEEIQLASMSKMLCPDGSVDIRKCLADLYYDLGGTAMPKQYGNLCQMTTKDHILYGSDTPFTPLPLCSRLAEAMDQGLTDEMQELVYRENPKKLLSR